MPTLHDSIHVTIASDDKESFEIGNLLVTIQARITQENPLDSAQLYAAIRDIGQRVIDSH